MYLFVVYLKLRSVTFFVPSNDRMTSEWGITKDLGRSGVTQF